MGYILQEKIKITGADAYFHDIFFTKLGGKKEMQITAG